MRLTRLVLAITVGLTAACASAPGPQSAGPRSDSRTITRAELATAAQTNLYDYIAAARPRWLQSRSPANLGGRSLSVAVFLGNQNMGGTAQLRSFSLSGITTVRYYDAAEAQARFNVRDVGGVIQIIPE